MSETEDPNIDRLREEVSEKRERLDDLRRDSNHVHRQAELDALSREIHDETVELVGREMLDRQRREGEHFEEVLDSMGEHREADDTTIDAGESQPPKNGEQSNER
jgi:predicted  nucleic acid-binding Zn-ribbon protein